MICKIATITHSSNALDYCEKGGELIHANGVYGNAKDINSQFKEVQALKPNIKHKSVHAIISFNPRDKDLSKGDMMEISELYAKQHGFNKNQYAVYLHQDKEHTHLHIVANRIGLDRTVISSSHSYPKNTEFSKTMEQKYDLIKTNRKTKGKDFVSDKSFAKTIKSILDETLIISKSLKELEKHLKSHNITMYKGRGVAFVYLGTKVKGSEIGRKYSLKGLEKQIQNIHYPTKHKASSSFIDRLKREREELNKETIKEPDVVKDFNKDTKRKSFNYGTDRDRGEGMKM